MEVFMSKFYKQFFTAKNVAILAMLSAFVLILQGSFGSFRVGMTSFSVTLIPIVLGAILLGPLAGGILGALFGLIVYLFGVTGADPFTNVLFVAHPLLTALVCFGKGIMAGVVPALLYKLFAKKNTYLAVFVAALSAPIVNTGLFLLGSLTLLDTLSTMLGEGQSMLNFLFIGCAGVNFIVEFLVNLAGAPAIYTVLRATAKSLDATL